VPCCDIGTLLHHTAAAWNIVGNTTHLFPMSRANVQVGLPLMLQHLVVLSKYHNYMVYAAAEMSLEIFWEWELFAALNVFSVENGYHLSARGVGLQMVFAHWLFLGAAALALPKLLSGVCGVRSRPSQERATPEELNESTMARWAKTTPRIVVSLPRSVACRLTRSLGRV